MPETLRGIILSCNGGRYEVFSSPYRYSCYAKGAFRHLGTKPIAGDRVLFVPGCRFEDNGTPLPPSTQEDGYLLEVLPRTNLLHRPPCANLDQLLIVVSIANPAPDLLYLDRLTVLSQVEKIRPVICFNKSDLDPKLASNLTKSYTESGFLCFPASFTSDPSLPEALCEALKGKLTALAGFSGVGKTSLFNLLFPGEQGSVGGLSEKILRGKNTTRQTVFHSLLRSILKTNGYLADAAGFSQLKLLRTQTLNEESLIEFFPDFEPYLGGCRYTKCRHGAEDGCAISSAVQNGHILQSRYESYLALREELLEQKPY